LGTNLLNIVPGQILKNGRFTDQALSAKQFTEKEMVALRRVDGLEYVVPVFQKNTTMSADGNTEFSQISATSEEFFPAYNWSVKWGSEFSKEDVRNKKKVAVIGPKLAQKLFGDEESAVGKKVKSEDQSYTVVGVLETKGGGSFGGPDLDSYTIIPYTTGYTFNPDKKISAFVVKVGDGFDIQTAKDEIGQTLLKDYKEDEFSIVEQKEILGAIESIFGVLNTVLIAIAAISLIVGGIGILNIMYVTVTERIKEIGIRRAIGARRNDILYQFLFEAVALSLLGGLTGLGLSALIVLAIQSLFPAYINVTTVALSLGVSSFIGVVFGVFPAKKAADLSPMEAIRYE